MTPRAVLIRALGVVAVAALLAPPAVGAADDEVVIEAKGLRPPVVRTTTARRVLFVNRSGRPAYVEVVGDPGGHTVFQVPGQIWARFHRPGRHPYVVQLGGGNETVELRGTVEVAQDVDEAVDPPTCDSATLPGVTVMGPCIAW